MCSPAQEAWYDPVLLRYKRTCLHRFISVSAFALLLLTIQGCTTSISGDRRAGNGEIASAEGEIETGARTEMAPAVVALLDSAEQASAGGDSDSAAFRIERALRLDPKNAQLWHRLAAVRFRQGDWQQVISLAQKSNSLASRDHSLQIANWQLIAAAREEMGDERGARDARAAAARLNR